MLPPNPPALIEHVESICVEGVEREEMKLTDELRQEYETRFSSLVIRQDRKGEASDTVAIIAKRKPRYESVSASTGVPWFVIGVLHEMECGHRSDPFDCHLFNGDPLTGRTIHAPAGRPIEGHPPFTWEQAAIAALKYERAEGSWCSLGEATMADWSIAATLLKTELYNGWGYRQINQPDPYIYAATQFYAQGKFIEIKRGGKYVSVYSPNLVSEQIGAAALYRLLLDANIILAEQAADLAR